MARGHVRKRGRVWYVVLEYPRDPLTNRRRQRWVRTPARNKREADAECVRLQREADTGVQTEPNRLTVATFVEEWLAGETHRLKPTTVESYRGIIARHIVPDLGALRLTALTPRHLARWQTMLRDRGLGPSRLTGVWNVLHGALAHAVRLQLLPRNPASNVPPPRQVTRERAGIWDESQARQFLTLVRGHPLEAAFVLVLATGLRKGELLGLRWRDVDLDAATLMVRQAQAHTRARGVYASTPKSAASRRVVPLPAFAVEALRVHRARQNATRLGAGPAWDASLDLVFTGPCGGWLKASALDRQWQRLRARLVAAGLPACTLHDLRHCHATLGLQRGIHPKVMSERLGHTTVTMTLDRYSHVLQTMQESAARAFDDLLTDAADDVEDGTAGAG